MGKVARTITGVVMTVAGFVTGNPALIFNGAAMVFSAVTEKKPKPATNAATEQRLSKSLVPEINRKIVYGKTAFPLDIRFWEVYGPNTSMYVEVFAVATHKVNSFGRLWINDEEVTFTGDNANGKYSGVLKRYTKTLGLSGQGLTIGSGTQWTSSSSFTGCAYFVLDWAWSQEKLPQGIPTKITQEGEGSPVYDPRRDISLGGTHNVNDMSTWSYSTLDSNGQPIGRNNALQALNYLLGGTIGGKLTYGRGVPVADIIMSDFITAANDCEYEQWYSDCVLSTGDSHSTNESIIAAASGGKFTDTGGLWGYRVSKNDTSNISLAITEDDIVGPVSWDPKRSLSEQYNYVSGSFIDPSSLYQSVQYPPAENSTYVSDDGFEKRLGLDLQAVQNNVQAQKLAFRKLQEGRMQGVMQLVCNWRALLASNFDVITVTYPPLGMSNKLFRLIEMSLSDEGVVLTLQETSPAIFATATIAPFTPPSASSSFDPTLQLSVTNLIVDPVTTGTGSDIYDGLVVSFNNPGPRNHHSEIQYKPDTSSYWCEPAIIPNGQTVFVIDNLLSNTSYNIRARHISVDNIQGPWSNQQETTSALANSSSLSSLYTSISNIQSDSVLSAGEKPEIIRQWAVITNEHSGLYSRGVALGATSEASTYNAAYSSLSTYLDSLTNWNILTQDTNIVGSIFSQKFVDYYSAKAALTAECDAKASIYLQPNIDRFAELENTLVDSRHWVEGALNSVFYANGTVYNASEVSIERITNHTGMPGDVIRLSPQASDGTTGITQWVGAGATIDKSIIAHNSDHIIAIPIKKDAAGLIYIGLQNYNSEARAINGVLSQYIYPLNCDIPTSYFNKWVLAFAVMQRSGLVDTVNSGLTGIYDPETGLKISGVSGTTVDRIIAPPHASSALYKLAMVTIGNGTSQANLYYGKPVLRQIAQGGAGTALQEMLASFSNAKLLNIEPLATVGARLGTNVKNQAGTITLNDVDLITQQGISAGFTGQNWGATASQNAIDNQYLQQGANQIADTRFRRYTDADYWHVVDTTSAAQKSTVINAGGFEYFRIQKYGGAPLNSILGIYGKGLNRFPVKANQRLSLSLDVAGGWLSKIDVMAFYYDAAGNVLFTTVLQSLTSFPGGIVLTQGAGLAGNFITVPSNPTYTSISIGVYGYTQDDVGNPYLFATQPMLAVASATQSALTPFNRGLEAQIGADITNSNIAAGFTGQGALAIKNNVNLATTDVLNKSLANLDATANTKLGGIASGATKNVTTSGLYSARPTGADGDFYYSTDTKTLYQKISGAWVLSANAFDSLALLDSTANSKLGGIEAGADVTANAQIYLSGLLTTTFDFAAGSPVSGQLPRIIQARAFKGGTEVTTGGAWSIANMVNCTVSVGALTGLESITALGGSGQVERSYERVFTYNSVAYKTKVTIAYNNTDTAAISSKDGVPRTFGNTINSGTYVDIATNGQMSISDCPANSVMRYSGTLNFTNWSGDCTVQLGLFIDGTMVYETAAEAVCTGGVPEDTGINLSIFGYIHTSLISSGTHTFGIRAKRTTGSGSVDTSGNLFVNLTKT